MIHNLSKQGRRIPLVVRGSVLLCILCTLVIAGLLILLPMLYPNPQCPMLEGDQTRYLIDPVTGAMLIHPEAVSREDRQSTQAAGFANEIQEAYAPDGRAIARMTELNAAGLHIEPVTTVYGEYFDPANRSGPQMVDLLWSPDGTRIAFLWRGDDKLSHIGIAERSGKVLLTRAMINFQGIDFYMNTWSSDNRYLSVALSGIDEDSQRRLIILNTQDLMPLAVFPKGDVIHDGCDNGPSGSQINLYCAVWATHGHHAVYLDMVLFGDRTDKEVPSRLVMLNADQGTSTAVQLPQGTHYRIVIPSPSGRIVAVVGYANNGPDGPLLLYRWGESQPFASLTIDDTEYAPFPDVLLKWTADERYFFYPRHPGGATQGVELVRYDTQTRQGQTLLGGLAPTDQSILSLALSENETRLAVIDRHDAYSVNALWLVNLGSLQSEKVTDTLTYHFPVDWYNQRLVYAAGDAVSNDIAVHIRDEAGQEIVKPGIDETDLLIQRRSDCRW